MLDWSIIDNEKLFQRLVNDLFNLDLGRPGFIPSSSYIGADGGWDGRFDISYLGMNGVSSVQSKWTKHNLDDAFKALRPKMEPEIEKAQRNSVDNLLIATNAELRVQHVTDLQALGAGKVTTLLVYYRERLEPLIEKYPYLLHKYFGRPQQPFFVPGPDYAAISEREILGDLGMLERQAEYDDFRKFLNDDRKQCLLIHAPQGEGKSHFVLEAAKRTNDDAAGVWQCWFCRPSVRSVESAIQDELHTDKSYVIILDNADLYDAATRQLTEAVRSLPTENTKLVMTCRSYSKNRLVALLDALRIKGGTLKLNRFSEDSAIELLKKSSGEKPIEHPERLVKYLNYNPFLIISYGRLMAGQGNPDEIKTEIVRSVISASAVLHPMGFSENECAVLMREIAAASPLRFRADPEVQLIATLVGKPIDQVRKAIIFLEQVQMLRWVGSTIRFDSDINGNVFLAYMLDGHDGVKETTDLYARWKPVIHERVAMNLTAAAGNAETQNIHTAIGAILRQVTAELSSRDLPSPRDLLHEATYFARIAPEEVAALLFVSLEVRQEEPINRDVFGSVIETLSSHPGATEHALDLTRRIAARPNQGTYSNYEPHHLVKRLISPITHTLGSAIFGLQVLEKWANTTDLDAATTDLIAAGIEEALAGSHHYDDSFGGGIAWGRKILVYSEKVAEYRATALNILKTLIHSEDRRIQRKAISLIVPIGREADPKAEPLWQRIVADQTEVILEFQSLMEENRLALGELAELENALLHVWAHNHLHPELSALAEALLDRIPRVAEFTVQKLFIPHGFILLDFPVFKATTPATDRWKWLVKKHLRGFQTSVKDLRDLVQELDQHHRSADEMLGYLTQLDSDVSLLNTTVYVPLVESWAELNTDPFLQILSDPALKAKIPPRFVPGFDAVAARNLETFVPELGTALAQQEVINQSEISRFLAAAEQARYTFEKLLPWMNVLIPKLDTAGRQAVWFNAFHLFYHATPEDQKDVITLLDLLLTERFTPDEFDSADSLIRSIEEAQALPPEALQETRAKISDSLKAAPKLNYHGVHLVHWVVENDLSSLLDFIEYRLAAQRTEHHYGIDAVPNDGFPFMKEMVSEYEAFCTFADRVVDWAREDLITDYDFKCLFRGLRESAEADALSFLIRYISDKLAGETTAGLADTLSLLPALPLTMQTMPLYLDILHLSTGTKHFKNAISAFELKALPGSYSSNLGEPPPELVAKREVLVAMKSRCTPGRISILIDTLIVHVDAHIERELSDAQEILNPKS